MCQMWNHIRHGARWQPEKIIAHYMKRLSLKNVAQVHIAFDPFHPHNASIREMWHALSTSQVKQSNPACGVQVQLANDREPPVLTAQRNDGLKLIYKTERLTFIDLLEHFCANTLEPEKPYIPPPPPIRPKSRYPRYNRTKVI